MARRPQADPSNLDALMEGASGIPVPDLSTEPPHDPLPEPAPMPSEEPKRRRGRRKKEPEPQPQAPPVSPEDKARCAQALALSFRAAGNVLGTIRGPHWRLAEEECKTLGDVWAEALAPYLAKVGPAVPWVTAIVVTGTIALPRIEEDAKRTSLPPAAAEGDEGPDRAFEVVP